MLGGGHCYVGRGTRAGGGTEMRAEPNPVGSGGDVGLALRMRGALYRPLVDGQQRCTSRRTSDHREGSAERLRREERSNPPRRLCCTRVHTHGARLCVHGAVLSVHSARLCVHGAVLSVHSARLCVHGATPGVHSAQLVHAPPRARWGTDTNTAAALHSVLTHTRAHAPMQHPAVPIPSTRSALSTRQRQEVAAMGFIVGVGGSVRGAVGAAGVAATPGELLGPTVSAASRAQHPAAPMGSSHSTRLLDRRPYLQQGAHCKGAVHCKGEGVATRKTLQGGRRCKREGVARRKALQGGRCCKEEGVARRKALQQGRRCNKEVQSGACKSGRALCSRECVAAGVALQQ